MITVCKFGGSSVADANQFKKIKDIILADDKRKAVVVSAPGKRFSKDNKVTDLLYLLAAHIRYGVDPQGIFDILVERYQSIANDLAIDFNATEELNIIVENYRATKSDDYLVSRGEYLSAKLMSKYLGFTFVDAIDVIHFDYNGKLNNDKTTESLRSAFEEYGKIVVPGFYGSYPTGEVKLFSRGGSDISGSIVAMGLEASLYENWTDVSGLLIADPRIIEGPKVVDEITYDELRELSYMGASVLHEETIFPVKELNIPIQILNTNRPLDKGTTICRESSIKDNIITGIAGKKNYKVFSIIKDSGVEKINIIRKVLDVFDSFKVPVEHIPTSIDSFGLVVDSKDVDKKVYDIISELKAIPGIINIDVDNDLALVAIVGRNMALKAGISGQIFSIFGRNKINIKTISQSVNEMSIIIGVSNNDFEKSIKSIYSEMIG